MVEKSESGVYGILKIIIDNNLNDFEHKEIKKYIDICSASLTRSLTNLVKLGLLERTEEKRRGTKKRGRIVKYRIKGENERILINSLFK